MKNQDHKHSASIDELEERLEFSGWLGGGETPELGECPEEDQPCSGDSTSPEIDAEIQ